MSYAGAYARTIQVDGGSTVDVVYASDEKYARVMAVSILSLLDSSSDPASVRIHVLSEGITTESQDALTRMVEDQGSSLSFRELPDLNRLADVTLDFKEFSISTFARLWLPDFYPDLQRVLYIDCDTVVLQDLGGLWCTELPGTKSVAGVLDALSEENKRKVGLAADDPYINAGVMLIDVAKWRMAGTEETFVSYLREHGGVVPHNDQGVINACLTNEIVVLPPTFNVMSYCLALSFDELRTYKKPVGYYERREYDTVTAAPKILHATGSFLFDRPWVAGSRSPIADIWLATAARTPWSGTPLETVDPGLVRSALRWACSGPARRPTLAALGVVHSLLRDRIRSV